MEGSPVELWTAAHARTILPALVVMLGLSVLLRKLLKNKPLKTRMLPVRIIALVLVLLEVGKQAFSFARGYDLYHIPLHICSLFVFVIPAMAFYRGKHCHSVRAVAAALCTAVFALMMIYPNLIYSAGNIENFLKGYLDFHTVAFHNLIMLLFMLLLALDLHGTERGQGRAVVGFTTGYCVVAATMAHVLKTNYANFYQCNIPPLETLRLNVAEVLGTVPTQFLYALIVSVLTVSFILGSYQLYRVLNRINAWKKTVAEQPCS
jgi:hypothetical protein